MAPTKSAVVARNLSYQAQSDMLLSVCGDGTINQVVSGLAPRKQPPTLAIYSEGTVNNLAKVLHIPCLLPLAIKNILEAKPQPLDMSQVKVRTMVRLQSLGVLANAACSVTQKEKRHLCPIITLLKGFKVCAQHQHWIHYCNSAHNHWEKDTQFLLVSKSNSVCGLQYAVPDAAVEVGHLHVFIAPKLTWWRSHLAIPTFITGNFQKHSGKSYFATEQLLIEAPKTLQSRESGDPSTKTPLKSLVIAVHIQVCAPPVGK